MLRYLAKSALLIGISVVVVCGVYPGILWVIGQTLFPFQTNGSIVRSDDGKVIGSLLVAQPFTKDEYFQPRPSAASYDATASTSSGYAPSNYALRDRVARVLGPIVTYASGDKKGQPVAPDVEAWFKADKAAETRTSSRNGPTPTTASRRLGSPPIRRTGPMSTPGRRPMTTQSRSGSRRTRRRRSPRRPILRCCSSKTSRTIIPACSPRR